VIDPEAVPPAPPARRHRRAVVAGVTLLAVVAGGIAVAFDGNGSDAKPLALMAGNGVGGGAETMAAQSDAKMSAAPAVGAAGSRSALYPYGGWGLKFEVEGELPELPDHAAAWRVNTPLLDRATLVRIAEALGVPGTPVQRDGGWFVDGGDWTLSAFGGDAMGKGGAWYLNLYRSRFDGRPDDAAGHDAPTGPAIPRADAERRVLELLDRMGAPRASWAVETTDTEIGVGWACAAPGLSPEELRRLEAEKLRQLEQENGASSGSGANQAGATTTGAATPTPNGATVVVDPAPPAAWAAGRASGAGSSGGTAPADKPVDSGVASCPPPPPPVKGFSVALYPVLDGRRADWPVWNVTMRSDGRFENLSGSWVSFERGGDYRLRGVDAALEDLQSPGVLYATDSRAAIEPAPALDATPAAGSVKSGGAAAPAIDASPAAGSVESGGTATSGANAASGVSSPAVDLPAQAPVCSPVPMPMPVGEDKAVASMPAPTCPPPAPQVVKITGVELGLLQTSVFENGEVRLALVPSYRFVGRFDNGTPWQTSVVALHPEAIAPPPDLPVSDGARRPGDGAPDLGKAVPLTPGPEPAIARDFSSR
jgi:hypothetical protein